MVYTGTGDSVEGSGCVEGDLTVLVEFVIPNPDVGLCTGLRPVPEIALGLADTSRRSRRFCAYARSPRCGTWRNMPFRGLAGVVSRTGDRARLTASRRTDDAGEFGAEPTSRGVKGVLVLARKLALSAGVIGFWAVCLSGILEDNVGRVLDEGGRSRVT